ncbi:MAG: 2Fe-2S iron-sulfur cluster binding domain-containing protein [Saprospiraceae bacterium]|nr:2Fe-2S iron-sulfur cluster binding domain-containing protein [Saprospiraceae bacterium]
MSEDIKLNIKVWRQKNNKSAGGFETYPVNANEHMSFLEMLDVLNEDLVNQKKEPVAFEHDCREGICGTCSLVINGQPHGPNAGTTTCQLHMRHFKNGEGGAAPPPPAGPPGGRAPGGPPPRGKRGPGTPLGGRCGGGFLGGWGGGGGGPAPAPPPAGGFFLSLGGPPPPRSNSPTRRKEDSKSFESSM